MKPIILPYKGEYAPSGVSPIISPQAFIAPGVEIGAGSMVSAGSVVLDSVPPGSIVRGNPAGAVGR